jgi:predicted TIM-barrel fold metal-dependent hydrolase
VKIIVMSGCANETHHAMASEVISDRILFSTDYPYESAEEAAKWFDNCPISEPDRVKMGRGNAVKLFNLQTAAESNGVLAAA